MKITEKLKEVLTPEDLKQLESAIGDLVTEQVTLKTEEIEKKYKTISEETIQKEVDAKVSEIKTMLDEEFQTKLQSTESELVEKLDQFLDSEISEHISNDVISKIAINEACQPIVLGIKKLFAENYLELDSEGSTLLKDALSKMNEMEEQINSLTEESLEFKATAEKAATRILLNDKVKGLNEEQTERVQTFFEGKTFEEVQEKIDAFVDVVLESKEVIKDDELNEDHSATGSDDGLEEQVAPKAKDGLADMTNDILSKMRF